MLDLLSLPSFSPKHLNLVDFLEPFYHFDGKSGAIIPQEKVPKFKFDVAPFTVSTVFRHKNHNENNKHTKEHIMCIADDHSK